MSFNTCVLSQSAREDHEDSREGGAIVRGALCGSGATGEQMQRNRAEENGALDRLFEISRTGIAIGMCTR